MNYHSHAVFLDEKERNQDVHDEWDKKLDRMIFLLGEMGEESCTQQNPYAMGTSFFKTGPFMTEMFSAGSIPR